MSERAAEIAAWSSVREVVTEHLAHRRAEVDAQLGMGFVEFKALRRLAGGGLSMGEPAADLGTRRDLVERAGRPTVTTG